MAQVTYYGTGRRKTSVARVRLVPGDGKVTINGREMAEYFGLKTLELIVRQPLNLTADAYPTGQDCLCLIRSGTGCTLSPRAGTRRYLYAGSGTVRTSRTPL